MAERTLAEIVAYCDECLAKPSPCPSVVVIGEPGLRRLLVVARAAMEWEQKREDHDALYDGPCSKRCVACAVEQALERAVRGSQPTDEGD